ncbi:MSHA biogenesis protein MshK [Shewanella sp. SW36]|uniref:MSHA biogenesis protein MshK n=1 Tax=Shewanella TaxID=22 RepID=UPI0021DAC9CF|nr:MULTISPECIES: MSHA biogenesis protein MshK [unclassified Shewanella]MCU7975091.1 MSHA biogenesis protein MshK [Shewanella sp. SW36]MCU7990480.1 MSHA biogenesis protein MshK [Shewanella sp. SW1]MCU8016148.1 MSHA biogenesis protein MshK [Shewanella sp. SM72]MCU8051685.1 MSHA biogenesis protein MshK [Shewanella sp. SM43]
MFLNKSYIISMLLLVSSTMVSAESLRDPTLPGKGFAVQGHASQTQDQALVLNSIVSSGNTAYAVINNKILSVGDSVQGLSIVKITPTYVSLSDGRKLTLFQAITER